MSEREDHVLCIIILESGISAELASWSGVVFNLWSLAILSSGEWRTKVALCKL